MEIIFWGSFSLIIAVYFGYPLFLVIATMFKNKPVNKADFTPSVSLLIPAYNEEKSIRAKIENSLSLDYPKNKLEIIVISDESTDKTEDITKEYLDRGAKLIVQDKRKGKMAALNKAVLQAKGEIIVFSDADVMYENKAVRNLASNFNDEKIGCVCGELRCVVQSGTSVELGNRLHSKYEKFLIIRESRLQSLLVTSGCIYAIRKNLFKSINETLADDFVNPLQIAAKGFGVVYESKAIALLKLPRVIREELKRKARTIAQGVRGTILFKRTILSSGLLRFFQYLLHKFLRWLAPLFLILIFIFNFFLLDSLIYQWIFAIQVSFYVVAFIGYILQKRGSKIKVFYIPFYFCLINLASLIGLVQVLGGKQKGIWEKAETTR